MSKKLIITIISSAVILLIGILVTVSYNRGIDLTNLTESKEKKIEENGWVSVIAAEGDEALRVEWDQKYGFRRTEYCKVVFYNKKEGLIKLVAPWLEMTIVEANMNNIKYKKVPIDSIPKMSR